MTNHIPPEKLLPQDMVELYDHGPADQPHATPTVHRMHASDAKHAMDVEPGRYALEAKHSAPKLEIVRDETDEDDGA